MAKPSFSPIGQKSNSSALYSQGQDKILRYAASGTWLPPPTSAGGVTRHSIRYGLRSIVEDAPAWPELPVEQREEFDFVAFMDLLASLSKLATAE